MDIHTFSSDTLAKQAKGKLETLLKKYKNKPILLMLSGGSSFQLLEGIDDTLLGKHITISVLDERFSSDPQVNNFLQLQSKAKDFFNTAKNNGVTFIETVPKSQESLDKFSNRWEEDLRKWIKKHPNRVTIATVGIGSDGHVAGISPFPGEEERFVEFIDTADWVKGYSGNLTPTERVTVTARFLEDKIDQTIVFVSGEGKREALEKVLANHGMMAHTPARILREMINVTIFTDIVL